MPGGDRTGPMGQGSMTGRGFGFCVPKNQGRNFSRGGMGFRNFFNRGMGFRNFFNRGMGLGWRFNNIQNDYPYNASDYNADDEKEMLMSSIQNAQNEINALQNRLKELENKTNS